MTLEGREDELPRPLSDEDILYLQEDLTVTDDIFRDEHVIFSAVTPEWAAFCKDVLRFEVPVDVPASVPAASEDGS